MKRVIFLYFGLWVSQVVVLSDLFASEATTTTQVHAGMVRIDGGLYQPLYKENGKARNVTVEPFFLDQFQVTNREFLLFVEQYPKWRANQVSPIFADQGYLSHLDSRSVSKQDNQPVTYVSWYAAMAYCKAQGKSLPSTEQWEFAAQANDISPLGIKSAKFKRKILDWYAKPATDPLPDVHDTEVNYWGVYGMHGVVWEQVSDFNSALVTGESRGDSALDKQLFCGSGATQAADPGDYAAFMRYALRSSYAAEYTLATMGFRCVKDR